MKAPEASSGHVLACDNCEQACTAQAYDAGIGPLEVWGRPMNHSQIDYQSDCCEAALIEIEE